MAGSSGNWFKSGPGAKGRVYVSNATLAKRYGTAAAGKAAMAGESAATIAQLANESAQPAGQSAHTEYPLGSPARTSATARQQVARARDAIAAAQQKIDALYATAAAEGRAGLSSYEMQQEAGYRREMWSQQWRIDRRSQPPGARTPEEQANLDQLAASPAMAWGDSPLVALPDKVGPKGGVQSWKIVSRQFGTTIRAGLSEGQRDMQLVTLRKDPAFT